MFPQLGEEIQFQPHYSNPKGSSNIELGVTREICLVSQ